MIFLHKIRYDIEHILRAVRRYSLLELIRRLFVRIKHRVWPCMHYVYVYRGTRACVLLDKEDLFLREITGVGGAELDLIHQVETLEGALHVEHLLSWRSTGARLFFLCIGGLAVGHVAIVQGRFVDSWYIQLKPTDSVIYGANVFPQYRGRGFAPRVYMMLAEKYKDQGDVYIDTLSDNRSAIRAIEKAGFVEVGTYRRRSWRNPTRG